MERFNFFNDCDQIGMGKLEIGGGNAIVSDVGLRGFSTLSINGLHAHGIALVDLRAVRCLAALPSFVNAFPSAEVRSGFVKIVVTRQPSRHQEVVKVLAEKAVFFFVKRETAFELLHFQDEFVQFHRVSPFKHFHSALAPLT